MPEEGSWSKKADDDAKDTVSNFFDEIVDMLYDDGEASTDLFNDYPNGDSYHHENHVDTGYSLKEAAALLEDLSDYEETDSGLWEGLEPRRAIEAMAAFTYGNAVLSYFQDLVEEINDKVGSVKDDMEQERNEAVEEWEAKLEEEEITAARKGAIEKELDKLSDEEHFEHRVKKRIRKEVEIAAGIKKLRPVGPKEWEPE